jgi:hypothetical protein
MWSKSRGSFAVVPLICVLGGLGPTGQQELAREAGVTPAALRAAGGSGATLRGTAELDGPATPMDYGDCGPGARREPGLQGEIPLSAQRSGDSAKGYQCNVRRVGQNTVKLRGQNFQLAWYGDCAYVSTVGIQAYTGALGEPDPSLDGIAAIDVSDPLGGGPKLTDVVKSPYGVKSSHEAIEVNQARGLLVTELGGLISQYIEVYDVKDDCRHPKYLGRYDAGIPLFHGLRVADDGRTVYATDTFGLTGFGQMLHAVDISDPRHPRRLLTWDPIRTDRPTQYASHDLDVSPDGDRLYLGTAALSAVVGLAVGGPSKGTTPSLAILDSSEVQARRPGADLRVISTLSLPNFGHTVQRIRVGGKPYLLVSGEAPIGGGQECPWAWGHIVDVSDERHPRRVSDLRLQVNQQRYCGQTANDGGAIYSVHYVGVDDEQDTRYVFYTYYTGGLRVFDVHDPEHPTEVGYYQPPPTPDTTFVAASPITPDAHSSVLDNTTSVVRFRPETGELWIVSVNSGFQVLQLTGELAQQRLGVRLTRVSPRRALRAGGLKVRTTCAQPCAGTVELRVGGRRAARRAVALPLRGSATSTLRLDARARAVLRRRPAAEVTATFAAHDRLTGDGTLRARTARRPLG